ncbi:MAG: glycoside hydrolase family 15 protein [Streptosporangiaceae bacterium]
MNGLPIGDYALLSDCRSAALVSRVGSVDWLCCPRFDAPAVFARILDADGGHFAIRPAGDFQASRAYIDQTMALETTFRAEAGTAVLTDAMAMGRDDRGHQLGAGSPGVLMRKLQCTRGELDVDVTYAPRPEYGSVTQQFLAAAADVAASRWTEKDQGIWEIRGEPRDFLYSKLTCWVALDRAIALAPQLGAEDRTREWAATRDKIRAAILERGWNEQAGAFTQAFGSEDLDASSLMLAITGFLAGDDPRMKATIDAIAARLTDKRGLVYRYLAHDGLAGEEGTFLLCTFWLAHAQAVAGELDRATATFGRAMAAINDVGLLAEEVDPGSGEMIGNFPQAFSHIGLINAAWAIAQAQERTAGSKQAAAAGKNGPPISGS